MGNNDDDLSDSAEGETEPLSRGAGQGPSLGPNWRCEGEGTGEGEGLR